MPGRTFAKEWKNSIVRVKTINGTFLHFNCLKSCVGAIGFFAHRSSTTTKSMNATPEPTSIPMISGESQGEDCPPTFNATTSMESDAIRRAIPPISSCCALCTKSEGLNSIWGILKAFHRMMVTALELLSRARSSGRDVLTDRTKGNVEEKAGARESVYQCSRKLRVLHPTPAPSLSKSTTDNGSHSVAEQEDDVN